MSRRLTPVLRAARLAVVVLAGAAISLAASGFPLAGGFAWRGATTPPGPAGALTLDRFVRSDVWLPVWRPLRVAIRAQALDGRRTLTVEAPGDGGQLQRTLEPGAAGDLDLRLTRRGERDGRVTLYWSTAGDGAGRVTIESLHATPVVTVSSLVRYALPGALAGALAALLLWPHGVLRRRLDAPAVDRAEPKVALGEPALAALATASLLLLWAVAKPPLQAPDEPQHLGRAAAVRLAPWIAGVQSYTVDPSRALTFVWHGPETLHHLIGRPDRFLTRADVAALKAQPAVPAPATPRIPTAVASYPPLFYWYEFVAADAARRLGFTPWQTLFAMRLAGVLLVSAIWGAVYVALRQVGASRGRAALALALLVGAPMSAFLASSVTPDAPATALAAWLVVLAWRGLRSAWRPWSFAGVAVALLFTKPSGIQIVLAILAGLAVCAWRAPESRPRAMEMARVLLLALLGSWAVFYAWSPPALSDGAGLPVTLSQYVLALPGRASEIWVMLWGKLGWVEYQAAGWLYLLVLATVVAAGGWMAASPREEVRAAVTFFAPYALLFVISTLAGELASLHRTGYMLQGRYFLPLLVCLTPAMIRGPRLLGAALGLSVALLHVSLFWLTIQRYWRGDVLAVLESLPF